MCVWSSCAHVCVGVDDVEGSDTQGGAYDAFSGACMISVEGPAYIHTEEMHGYVHAYIAGRRKGRL